MAKKGKKRLVISPLQGLLPGVASLLLPLLTIFGFFLNGNPQTYAKAKDTSEILIFRQENDSPLRILIPKIYVDLNVKEANLVQDTWEVSNDSASFGLGSSYLNEESGNTVIFAHAKDGLFSRIDELEKKDKIFILGRGGWYMFEVSQKKYVSPTDTSLLKSDFEKNLILISCYGFEDEKRAVIVARLVGTGSGKEG